MLQVGLLLGATQALAALALGLVGVQVVLVLGVAPPLVTVLFYPLGLGLLVCGGSGLGLGFGLGSLCGLFALRIGVFGGVPRVQDLRIERVC